MRVKKQPLRRLTGVRLFIPLIVALMLTTGVLVYAHGSKPPTSLNVARTGLITSSATPLPNDPLAKDAEPTATPTPQPSPTPTVTPTIHETQPDKAATTTAGCAALQTKWQQSLGGTMADAAQELNRSLSNLLLDLDTQNKGIDSYNKAVQSAYNALAAQAKSAQCNLDLSAPAMYPHEH